MRPNKINTSEGPAQKSGTHLINNFVQTTVFAATEYPAVTGAYCVEQVSSVGRQGEQRIRKKMHFTVHVS